MLSKIQLQLIVNAVSMATITSAATS